MINRRSFLGAAVAAPQMAKSAIKAGIDEVAKVPDKPLVATKDVWTEDWGTKPDQSYDPMHKTINKFAENWIRSRENSWSAPLNPDRYEHFKSWSTAFRASIIQKEFIRYRQLEESVYDIIYRDDNSVAEKIYKLARLGIHFPLEGNQ